MEVKGDRWVYSREAEYLTEPGAVLLTASPSTPFLLCSGVTEVHGYTSLFNMAFGDLNLDSLQAFLLAEPSFHLTDDFCVFSKVFG